MNNRFPFITCYSRILDRITLEPLTEFKDTLQQEKVWDLGIVHNDLGGYSQYLIEFDIWNNEPDVSAGMTQKVFDNAENCKVSIQINNGDVDFDVPIFQIRNSTFEKQDFINIIKDKFSIHGNVDRSKIGTLHGNGDHSLFQVGIQIPNSLNLTGNNISFKVCFEYEAQDISVRLPFDCMIKLTNQIMKLETINIGNNSGILSGEINVSKSQPITVEAYDINKVLKDQYIIKPETIQTQIYDIYGMNPIVKNKISNINSNHYKLFLQSGLYNFNIKSNLINRWFNNSIVENGIETFYESINKGLISDIHDDIVEYWDFEYNKTEIYGYIVNEYNELVEDAEIIITQDDNLIVYYKTNSDGKYKFRLDNGIYDVRLRSKNRKVKIFRDFKFDNSKGFFTELQALSSDFSKDFNFICK